MWTESSNSVPHDAKVSNLAKRYTLQKPTESLFLGYFEVRNQTTGTEFENLPRKGCQWQLEMYIFVNIIEAVAQKAKVLVD